MRFSSTLALAGAGAVSVNAAALQGFNYGATLTSGAAKVQSDFQAEFAKAQNLTGTSGWTSARLYTSIQSGTTNDPIEAIPAAIATNTKLLLGIWASSGQTQITNEIAAIENAISAYGTKFTDLVVGLSVGSEDLYRITPTGIANDAGVGAGPATIADYISQVKSKNWGFSIGHVDTWTAWTNSSNDAVIEAVDWVGFDGYPYFETTLANAIENGEELFDQSFQATVSAAGGKPVWMTESGWPVSGPLSGAAVASVANAETYWQAVACKLIGVTNTFWYTLQDAEPTTPSPSFGIIGSDINSAPLYDLTCSKNSTSTSSSSSASSSATSTASSSGSSSASTGASSYNGTSTGGSSGSSGSSGSATTLVPAVTGTSTGSSSGNSTAGVTYTSGSPTSSSSPAAYSANAATSTGGSLSSLAALVAFFGLVAHM